MPVQAETKQKAEDLWAAYGYTKDYKRAAQKAIDTYEKEYGAKGSSSGRAHRRH